MSDWYWNNAAFVPGLLVALGIFCIWLATRIFMPAESVAANVILAFVGSVFVGAAVAVVLW